MRDYGTIPSSFWDWARREGLSQDAVLLGAYLYTCRHGNSLGVFFLPPAYVSHDLRNDSETVSELFSTLCEKGFMLFCEDTDHVFIRDYLKHFPSRNPNMGKGSGRILEKLPDNFRFFPELVGEVQAYDPYITKVCTEMVSKWFRNIEPEPEPYPEKEDKGICPSADGGATPVCDSPDEPEEKPSGNNRNRVHTYTQAFEDIWEVSHPKMRNGGKKAAADAHKAAKRISDYPGDDAIVQILTKLRKDWDRQPDPWVVHLSKWFKEGRWNTGEDVEARKRQVEAERQRQEAADKARKEEAERRAKEEQQARIQAAWDELSKEEREGFVRQAVESSPMLATLHASKPDSPSLLIAARGIFARENGLAETR